MRLLKRLHNNIFLIIHYKKISSKKNREIEIIKIFNSLKKVDAYILKQKLNKDYYDVKIISLDDHIKHIHRKEYKLYGYK